MRFKSNLFVLFLIILLLVTSVEAVSLEGTLYNHKLTVEEGVWVSISTDPVQEIYSENGIYRFQLEEGSYTLTASNDALSASDEVTVSGKQKQYHDLVLFPIYIEQDNLFSESFGLAKFASPSVYLKELLISFAFFFVLFFIFFLLRNKLKSRSKPKEKKKEKKIKEMVISSEKTTKKETKEITVEVKTPELTADALDELINQGVEVEEKTKLSINKDKKVLKDTQEKGVAKDVEASVEDEVFALESELFDAEELLDYKEESQQKLKFKDTASSPEIDEDSAKYVSQVLRILKANGGTVPQSKFLKELSHLPEETVLTILNGLEFQEQIERVKKGRGYVITLK